MNKINSYIGLCQKSNNVLYGEDIIFERIKDVKVILLNVQATDKYKDRIRRRALNYSHVEVFEINDMFGAIHRDNVNSIGIKYCELAKAIINQMRE